MNRFTNKFHTDLKHLTKKEMNMTYYKIITVKHLPWIMKKTWYSLEDLVRDLDSLGLGDKEYFIEKVTKEKITKEQIQIVKQAKAERKMR